MLYCENCHAPIPEEIAACLYCGALNAYGGEKKYMEQLYSLKEDVKELSEVPKQAYRGEMGKVGRILFRTFLMFAGLVIVMIFVGREGPSWIWLNRMERDVEKNAGQYRQTLRTYEEEGNWRAFYALYDGKNIGYTGVMREYLVLDNMIFNYKGVLNELTHYKDKELGGDASLSASRIADYLDRFYSAAGRIGYDGKYFDECYTPERQKRGAARMRQGQEIREKPKRLRRDILLNGVIIVLCVVLMIQAVAFVVNLADYYRVYTTDEAALISMVSHGDYGTLVENVYRNEAYGAQVTGDMEQLYAVAHYYEAAMLYHAHRSAGNDAQAKQNYDNMLYYEDQMGSYAYARDEIWEFLGSDPEILK